MATRPSKLPQWAANSDGTDNDIIDPISSQNNVIEPDTGKKESGYIREEFPTRNEMNWLFRIIYQWIFYFAETIGVLRSVEVIPNSSGFTGAPTGGTMYCFNLFGLAKVLIIPTMGGSGIATDSTFYVRPVSGDWPIGFYETVSETLKAPCICFNDTTYYMGCVHFPASGAVPMEFWKQFRSGIADHQLDASSWNSDTTTKRIPRQVVFIHSSY